MTMKKYNTPWAVAGIVSALLLTSVVFNLKFTNLANSQRETIKHLSYKVDAQKKALELSDDIMDNNDLWDCDGSDVMCDYLHLRSEIDSDFMKEFHENALLDSLSFTYNE